MDIQARFPALLLFAIIFSGGFGLVRMTFVHPDLIGLSAIIVALALGGAYKCLATLSHPEGRRAIGLPRSKWPIQLALAASDSFEVFPGRLEGYVGYTDRIAMSVDVNDDLAAREPAEQYALVGFGNGFLKGIRNRIAESEAHGHAHLQFRVADGARKHKESIGWLAYLQRSGTDNGEPSTENLYSVIQSVSTDLLSRGPITVKFWESVPNMESESSDLGGTSLLLEEWTRVYQWAFIQGQRQALGAVIVATLPD